MFIYDLDKIAGQAAEDSEAQAKERGDAGPPADTEATVAEAGVLPPISDAALSASSSQLVGTRIGRYAVIRAIGSGGMGIVLSAYDEELDRRVAIKLLRKAHAEGARERMVREAQALARLSHANVVQVYEVGDHDGQLYLTMEYVEGRTLREWLEARPRTVAEILDVFIQVASGLHAAHRAGLIHRDLKPDNLLIDAEARARIIDFGLARTAEHVSETGMSDLSLEQSLARLEERGAFMAGLAGSGGLLSADLTDADTLVGTPGYMAPEQFLALATDERTDQFAFCLVLWEALYGQRAYAGKNFKQLAAAVTRGTRRPPPKDRSVPARLHAALERGLSTRPSLRWPTLVELCEQLEATRNPARPSRRWTTAGATIAAAVAITYAVQRDRAEVGVDCSGARDELAGVWDDARRQAVENALLATGVPHAVDTWSRVRQLLDERADRWVEIHEDACEATQRGRQSEELLDRRMSCLRYRRSELDALVSVLADADTRVLDRAAEATARLGSLERCSNAEALLAGAPPPSDPEVAERVDALRVRLETARVMKDAGRYQDALTLARELEAAAATLDFAPLHAEVLYRIGDLHDDLGDYPASERALSRAFWIGGTAGHDLVAARAATLNVWVVGHRQGRAPEGLTWGEHARMMLDRAHDRSEAAPLARAQLLNNLGIVLTDLDRLGEAEDHHSRSRSASASSAATTR